MVEALGQGGVATFLPAILAVPWMIELLSWGANNRTEWARGALLPFQMTQPLN